MDIISVFETEGRGSIPLGPTNKYTMKFDKNYRIISQLPTELIGATIDSLSNIQWTDSAYNRSEVPLTPGRLLELDCKISSKHRAQNGYNDAELCLLRSCDELITWIKSLDEFKLYSVARGEFATLLPNNKLGWHMDPRMFHTMSNRLHVPLITNSRCNQLWVNETMHMEVGYLYELNNGVLHSAENFGLEPRCHLILDVMPTVDLERIVNNGTAGMIKIPDSFILGEPAGLT